MAAAAPSPLASSVEKTNGAKLSRLLIDGGATVLRSVFDSFHPPTNLAANLNANYATLNNLFKKKVLHRPQWDLLFPPGGATPDSNTFDITLLFLLLTNICGLSPPLSGWHKPPPSSDTSREANLARIKLYRNELYGHVTSTGVKTAEFNIKWQEISAVLVALGLNLADVARLKAAPCGEDYISAVMEWIKSDEEIKSQLTEIRKSQHEARQRQENDHKTLEDTHKEVKDLRHIHQDTHQVVKELWTTQQEVHQKQEEHYKTLQDTHHAVEEMVKTQNKSLEALQQVNEKVEKMKERSNKDKEDEILRILADVNSEKVIEDHAEKYQEGTRVFFFESVEKWLDDRSSPNRVMVISGNAGMGKSVIAAVICKRMQEVGRLSGSHFCQHDKARYRNPKVMLQSLARQLSYSLPEYKEALVKTLSGNLCVELNNMEVKDLFELLFDELLSKLKNPGRNILLVVDGLDESEYQGRNELLDVISNHFIKLPSWIRFLVTTRPEINIADSLKSFKPLQLEPSNAENLKDLKLLLEKQLNDVISQDHQEVIINELVKKSEGLILHAYLLVHFIKENVSLLTPEQLDSTLPSGISSVYQTYFERLERELCKELKIKEEQFLIFLSALTAAREPLLLDFVNKMILPGTSSSADRRKVKKAIACISTLLPVRDDRIHFFHKSVKDWLTDTSMYGQHDFTVDETEGHGTLSKLCAHELDDIKRKGVDSAEFSDTAKYALKHGVQHVLHLQEDAKACEVAIKEYVVDLELVYAKLCVSSERASEDILWIKKQKIFQELSEDTEHMLNGLMFLLRKYVYFLNRFRNHPNVFFQTVLNEGETALSSMASNLLQDEYQEKVYMELVHKQTQQGTLMARFECSSLVACFDVSPQLDYMVCECRDRTIQLWSLHAGTQVWVRPVIVEKKFWDLTTACRKSPSSPVLSCYRSVVFLPKEDNVIVLPGVLSHAYTFDGDLKPLFPQSPCRFTVCSISRDKTTMLTDCPEDAKCIIMWSLKNGTEITRTTRDNDVLSFAWSSDGRLLAISHCTGLVSFVDVRDRFRTIAEHSLKHDRACGMIKFTSDGSYLFCSYVTGSGIPHSYFLDGVVRKPSIVFSGFSDQLLSKLRSPSVAGFLLGDPLSSFDLAFDFVLADSSAVLRGSSYRTVLDMLNINKIWGTGDKVKAASPFRSLPHLTSTLGKRYVLKNMKSVSFHRSIAFSLTGEVIYVVTNSTATAWDVSSEKCVGHVGILLNSCLEASMKQGVLLSTENGCCLEMWNFKLSNCIRRWPNLVDPMKITQMIPISEERVALSCANKVIILNTTTSEVVSIPNDGDFVTCNSKCQLLICSSISVQLLDGQTTLWRTHLSSPSQPAVFSFTGQFVVICAETQETERAMYVLDAFSGRILHILCNGAYFLDCQFVSEEECVILSRDTSGGSSLRLFNVESGELLTVIDLQEREVSHLAVCPRKRLLAIGQRDSNLAVELIQVYLPRAKESRKNKR